MKIKRVLIPTDFSPFAEAALDQALFWARLFDAEIHLLHVIALHSATDPDASFPELGDLHDHLERFATGQLAKLRERDGAEGLRLHTARIRAISAAPGIVSYAQEQEVDLIVMGTHGRRGVRRFLLGSVTEEVIRTAHCPILTIRGRSAGEVEPIRRILVPFDFSDEARSSLREAESLAETHGAKVDLLHVVAPPIAPGALAGVPLPTAPNDELLKQMQKSLRELAAESPMKAQIETHVLEGSPAWEICDLAQKADCDLIIQGSHGLSGMTRLLLGSVSEKVARLAGCPVLILRSSTQTKA